MLAFSNLNGTRSVAAAQPRPRPALGLRRHMTPCARAADFFQVSSDEALRGGAAGDSMPAGRGRVPSRQFVVVSGMATMSGDAPSTNTTTDGTGTPVSARKAGVSRSPAADGHLPGVAGDCEGVVSEAPSVPSVGASVFAAWSPSSRGFWLRLVAAESCGWQAPRSASSSPPPARMQRSSLVCVCVCRQLGVRLDPRVARRFSTPGRS